MLCMCPHSPPCHPELKHTKRRLSMGHPSLTLESGLAKVLSPLNAHQGGIICTCCPTLNPMICLPTTNGPNILCMQESPPVNNPMICNDKPEASQNNTQDTRSLKTLEVESTINEPAFAPYWNDCSKVMSDTWWLPTKTDLPDSDLISFNGSSNDLGRYWKAWKSQAPSPDQIWSPTSWKFSPSLVPATTDVGSTIRTQKIRIYPNTTQKALFHKCFGAHRYFYNRAVAEIKNRFEKRKAEFQNMEHCVLCTKPKDEGSWVCSNHQNKPLPWKLSITLPSLRAAVMQSDADTKGTTMSWQAEVPYDTRQLAIKDAISAYRSCTTNLARGNIEQFEMHFQRRTSRRIFWIDDSALVRKTGQWRVFQQRLKIDSTLRIRKKDLQKMPPSNKHDAKIMYDRGAYYLILSVDDDTKDTVRERRQPIVALDPGVRTFLTGYSPTGVSFKVGENQISQMKRLHERIDHLRSVRTRVSKRRTRWRIKQRLETMERALFGVVNDMHNQTTAALTRNYDTILLPTFGTSEMLMGGCIASTTKRRMQGLSHYSFQQKLIRQCKKNGCTLYLVGEEYTTKGCGGCGKLRVVGGDKIYSCPHCGYTMDRDVHGARNILIKTCSTFGQ